MSTQTTHQVKSGDTLYSLAKKYGTTVDKLKSLNGLKSDLIKVGQVLKVSDVITTTSPVPLMFVPKNWIIAKSEDYLGKWDSYNSTGKKLPPEFTTGTPPTSNSGEIYTLSKEQLLSEMIDLVELTSMGSAEEFTRYLVNQFAINKLYSLKNTYTHPKLVEEVRNSTSFKQYVNDFSITIRSELRKNSYFVPSPSSKEPLIKNYKRFHFKEEKKALFWTGLGIAINQVSLVKVEVNDVIYQDDKPVKLKTTFIVYDTFGLDDEDIEKYGGLHLLSKASIEKQNKRNSFQRQIATHFGWRFNCWWVLQYYHNCVPLLLELRIDNVEISL